MRSREKPGIDLEDAINEIGVLVGDAQSFKSSELEEQWATAERYYNGYTDLEEFEGRSNVTKTEVRDAVRNTLPSVMRILLQSHMPVAYEPSSPLHGMWVEQQGRYVNELFYRVDGYNQLLSAVQEAFKLKTGILKAWWEDDPLPEYAHYTKIPLITIEAMLNDPLMQVLSFEKVDDDATQLGVDLYNAEVVKHKENGAITLEAIPNYEFFISRNCTSIEQAIRQGVHGQQQVTTVAEAMDMGIDYSDNWLELDVEDPELSNHGESSKERRGYIKDAPNAQSSEDVLRHQFLLTEVYISYDLIGEGRPQLYRFLLGGTTYTYLHHNRVGDSPFSLIKPIPIPHNAHGHSIADLTVIEQDTSTSLLRAAVDNANASNDSKWAADPSKTNFDDLMSTALNAPVRSKQGAQIQTLQVPFTAEGTMHVLQYLDQDVQNKLGITKAAQGLDPDALQSTDKDAVRNTIMTGQGQTELMVRNIIQSGLIRVFRILLKLSIQHMEPIQTIKVKGKVIPVDTRMFDPDAAAKPNVGLGTASPAQKQAIYTMILERQELYMEKYGPNNPFTSFAQIYNTLEDLLEVNGVANVERHFNIVTPEVEKKWAQMQEKRRQEMLRMQQENQPMDPSKAYIEVEQGKRNIEQLRVVSDNRKEERELEFKAISKEEELDIKRDEMAQNRWIELLTLGQEAKNSEIKREQDTNKRTQLGKKNGTNVSTGNSGGSSAAVSKS